MWTDHQVSLSRLHRLVWERPLKVLRGMGVDRGVSIACILITRVRIPVCINYGPMVTDL